MIAVGVASPSASGQVMTTNVIANRSASSTSRSTWPHQTRKVPSPPIKATRTSQKAGPLILLAQGRAARRDRARDREAFRVAVRTDPDLHRLQRRLDEIAERPESEPG
jgi:Protein of unknown function (DUF1003)